MTDASSSPVRPASSDVLAEVTLPEPMGFPPYPPYAMETAPPSVAETIIAGRDLRIQHKSVLPKRPVRPPPKPARPRGPKATDVKLSKRAARAHVRCLRRHNAVLTDRLEYMSKPAKRSIIYLWREYADMLPADTIARLRSMLDADEPFKPDQAYEYFVNLKKTKKKTAALRGMNQIKKDMVTMCADKRFLWARNATVAFARGIQQRLSRPGRYVLADGMLRLSNIILGEICGHVHMRTPSRHCVHPKAKFMMEMSDKVAIWIDEILSESDDRMLMMDFDEDEDVLRGDQPIDSGFADDFLNMMGGKGGLLRKPKPAYLKFTGDMLDAFLVLTDTMYNKEDESLISYGKCKQSYREAADELKQATDFHATDFNTVLAQQLHKDLTATVKPDTPKILEPHMKDMVNICGNYLAQHAEFNKDKGPAFKLLTKQMKAKGNALLYQKDKVRRMYRKAAQELEEAKGLETDHDDPNLSQEIYAALSKTVENTPEALTDDMRETLDVCSKYLSEKAVDEIERGPAFDLLMTELEEDGAAAFTPEHQALATKFATAYTLQSAPGLTTITSDPETVPRFAEALHRAVDPATPKHMKNDMKDVIDRCANYLSAFVRDRDKAMQSLLKMMKANRTKILAKRNNYAMDYGTGAHETELAPVLVPFLPVKDISDEIKAKLTADMENQTPPALQTATKSLINDVSGHLSQPIALRSGSAGERYPLNFLAAAKKSLGARQLFKYKTYGQTYSDAADVLKYAGPLDTEHEHHDLHAEIHTEMRRGVPSRLAPTIAAGLTDTMHDASKHLAKVGAEKGEAMDYLIKLMHAKGEAPLEVLQGYQQSYNDGARRITITPTLTSDKVDKGAYESVRGKLTTLTNEKPTTHHEKHLPGLIDDSSKFLSAPLPESNKEKRQVLADLMARKGDEMLGKEGIYKMTYQEAGPEIKNAPVGVIEAQDATKHKETKDKVNIVVPDKKMAQLLKEPVDEGSAYLTDLIKGRGEAMQVIHDEMKKEGKKEFLDVGKFNKTHEQAADMLASAGHFGGQQPSPVLYDKVSEKVGQLPKTGGSEAAKKHMDDASNITSSYIAGVATKESGLGPMALAAIDGVGVDAGVVSAGAGGRAGGSGGGSGGVGTGANGMTPVGVTAGGMGPGGAAAGRIAPGGVDVGAMRPGGVGAGRAGADGVGIGGAGVDAAGSGAKGAGGVGVGARTSGVGERTDNIGAGGVGAVGAGGVGAVGAGARQGRDSAGGVGRTAGFGGEGTESATSAAERRRKGEGSTSDVAERRRREKEEGRRASKARNGRLSSEGLDDGTSAPDDLELGAEEPERRAALGILHKELRARGGEILYKQPHTALTHAQASQWLSKKPRMKVDKTIKESADTGRLHKKFERKLSALVNKKTPASMEDTMQDVIIESSRILSEYFVSNNYKALVRDSLISEMQKKGNEILLDVDGAAETYFFAAQRLKKANNLEANEPCDQVSYIISKKLDDMTRCRSMPRKLTTSMKEHIQEAADYLSEHVTKPDEQIEAYVSLLGEMQATGDALLIEGDIPKSYKNAASYLRQLTSFEDHIHRPNSGLQSSVEAKLKNIMSNVPSRGYTKAVLDSVIRDSTRLLVSYIMLQGEKTEALKVLIQRLEEGGQKVLLRHGPIRKSYANGADILREKNADQLGVITADPVVARKIQIKLLNLLQGCTPDKYHSLMDDVIEDATMYLAVYLLEPRVMNVCKCMKNVFVQCELWCDDILRRVTRPSCACSRHGSARDLSMLHPTPGPSLVPCPAQSASTPRPSCPAARPTSFCARRSTPSYFLYSTSHRRSLSPASSGSCSPCPPPFDGTTASRSHSPLLARASSSNSHRSRCSTSPPSLDRSSTDTSRTSPSPSPERDPASLAVAFMMCSASSMPRDDIHSSPVSSRSPLMSNIARFGQSFESRVGDSHSLDTFDVLQCESDTSSFTLPPPNPPPPSASNASNRNCLETNASDVFSSERPLSQGKLCSREARASSYSTMKKPTRTQSSNPIISTDQMCDWHAMMISLMWNVQAWRDWIQENIDRALSYQTQPDLSIAEAEENWTRFQRAVATEALQWRQYNIFSRQLTLRLALRYRDKQIVSPTRATNKTKTYMECQQEMLKIIEMFNRWTQWLTVVVKEANSLTEDIAGSDLPIHELRWVHFKRKVEEYSEDWHKYNTHLKVCWQHKYRTLISDWLPAWKQPGPVWVVSACGAVPSGAVPAGIYDSELVWVARTTHRCNVLPAALHPSKHCCIVYADGAVHHYTKYQVMCNAEARWIPWRAGAALAEGAGAVDAAGGTRAVRAAAGVHVGRVLYRASHLVGAVHAPHYRCHVVIFGRPFAFNCYELLVVSNNE